MEDLVHAGFGERCEKAALPTVKQGIRWLAYFHAKFLKQNTGKVWQCGTYWHLANRPDEFAKMQPSELKTQAGKIDATLNQAIYQTLLHGDAKLANFCFSADSKSMAGVDFQYVGRGAGIKDVMYFLGSCLESSDLEQYAESLVDDYFLLLQHAILENQIQVDFDELETEWRYLYSFAWADFHRFLMGWAAEHYKINDYMNRQTVVALAKC
jgi:thiamine kinase-like enzyme